MAERAFEENSVTLVPPLKFPQPQQAIDVESEIDEDVNLFKRLRELNPEVEPDNQIQPPNRREPDGGSLLPKRKEEADKVKQFIDFDHTLFTKMAHSPIKGSDEKPKSTPTVSENMSEDEGVKVERQKFKLPQNSGKKIPDEIVECIKANSKGQSIDDALNELMHCKERLEIQIQERENEDESDKELEEFNESYHQEEQREPFQFEISDKESQAAENLQQFQEKSAEKQEDVSMEIEELAPFQSQFEIEALKSREKHKRNESPVVNLNQQVMHGPQEFFWNPGFQMPFFQNISIPNMYHSYFIEQQQGMRQTERPRKVEESRNFRCHPKEILNCDYIIPRAQDFLLEQTPSQFNHISKEATFYTDGEFKTPIREKHHQHSGGSHQGFFSEKSSSGKNRRRRRISGQRHVLKCTPKIDQNYYFLEPRKIQFHDNEEINFGQFFAENRRMR